jgi:hypothetical protein
VGSGFDDWNYWTSLLQLQLSITVHTLNSFLITNFSLYFFWFSDWFLVPVLLSLILPLDSVSLPELASFGTNIERPVGPFDSYVILCYHETFVISLLQEQFLPNRCLATDVSIVLL